MYNSQLRLRVMLVTAAALAVAPAGTATGAEEGTRCTGELVASLSPGVGSEPTSGNFHSEGESGRIDCGGTVGTIGEDGRYGTENPVTCSSGGEGWGVHSITVDGKTIKNTFTFDFGGISGGLVSGNFSGERFSGTFRVTPIDGDCVSTPITRAKVELDGTLR